MKISYVTGNPVKFQQAAIVCQAKGVILEKIELDVDEMQSTSSETIARKKADRAFEMLGKPLVISDDNWTIPGLSGFPGPYMKYMNDWFTPNDWLRLTTTLVDRRITLRQVVVYQDANIQKAFSVELPATLLSEIRGKSPYAHNTITSFDGGKTSIAEHHERGESGTTHLHSSWHAFSTWYVKEMA